MQEDQEDVAWGNRMGENGSLCMPVGEQFFMEKRYMCYSSIRKKVEKQSPWQYMAALALACALALGGGCVSGKDNRPGFRAVSQGEANDIIRALDIRSQGVSSWTELRPAVERSLAYAQRRSPQEKALDAYGMRVTWAEIQASLTTLLELLPRLDAEPELLASHFTLYALEPAPLFTGYYEPRIQASLVRTDEYPYPLYGKPSDLKTVRLDNFHPRWKGQVLTYRVENGEVYPYHDRKALDEGKALQGRGLEVAWVRELAEVFFLQIQGSGRLLMPDGTEKHVLYAGKNGREYVSLGKVMKERGLLKPEDVSMQAIRAYLAAHPEEERALLNTNPSYVFFRLADQGPFGSMNQVLTPWVSLATDHGVLPLGSISLFAVPRPRATTKEEPLAGSAQDANTSFIGLGLAQDAGGAIKGHRIDLFSGSGPQAEFVAGHLAATGKVHILLPKGHMP